MHDLHQSTLVIFFHTFLLKNSWLSFSSLWTPDTSWQCCAAWDKTPHRTTPEQGREWFLKQNIGLDCTLVIARCSVSSIRKQLTRENATSNWQLLDVTTTSTTTRIPDITWDHPSPCYYFKYNFQTRPDFKWIRAKFLNSVMGINIAWFTFIFTQRNQDILSSSASLSL